MSLTRAQAQPIYTMGKQEVLGYSYPQDYSSTNVQSALTEIAQGVTWRELAQSNNTLITVSDQVSLSNISLNNAGISNLAVNSDIEELKDEIQLLKDEIENLKMLLLEN
jgi:hypothetical protein